MALTLGTRLGVYEIIAQIGEGGMGQVFHARDTKLDRDVAIKILPEAFAHDADRLARFTREAKTLASLNHPNIAGIYGLEESGGVSALAMELVRGDDLSQQIARGAIPIDEALPIAKQIAEALEAAHEEGIIHRDLKPANVKVRPDGTVKVLDFGLAKAFESGGTSAPATVSPTLSIHATQAGVILGTAAYMSPEQAAGKPVDKRSDLWAFGVVLTEMLTGRQVFAGETVSHVLASVLKDEPDWTTLPPNTPAPIQRLLRRCLVKDRKRRFADAIVGARFFDTLGLSLIAGRNLTERDTATSPQVAIVNQSMAHHFFGNDNPLGKHFESWGDVKEVVGVVQDAKYESPREEGQRMFYLPYRQQLGRLTQNVSVAIRTSGSPDHFESTIRGALSDVDPRLPVLRVETVEDQLDALLVPERATATFSLFFGVLAALLASIGLYGVMAYNAARRTGEIGLRLALGASRHGVVGMVLKETLSLVACGILLGIPAALAGGRMISARLFGVRSADPATIAAASVLMILMAALAGFLPALRAARVDPMAALRHE